jgi:hypothetical protein
LAKIIEDIKGWTISGLPYFEFLSLLKKLKGARVVRRVSKAINSHVRKLISNVPANELFKVIEVFFGMKASHFFTA